MSTFDFLLQGLGAAIRPMILHTALIGVKPGTAAGVLPGIGPALTVALVLPLMRLLGKGQVLAQIAGGSD